MTEILRNSNYFSEVLAIEDGLSSTCTILQTLNEKYLIFPTHLVEKEENYLRMFNVETGKDVMPPLKHIEPFYNFQWLKKKRKLLAVSWSDIFYFDPYKGVFEKIHLMRFCKFLGTCFSLQSVLSKEENYIILGSWLGRLKGHLLKIFLDRDEESKDVVLFSQEETIYSLTKSIKEENTVFFGGGDLLRNGGKLYSLRKIDVETGVVSIEFTPTNMHSNRINFIKTFVSSDNGLEYVISGAADKRIVLWSENGFSIRYFECKERVASVIRVNDENYIVGGAVHKKPGGNVFHFSLSTGKFSMLTEDTNGRSIWSLNWLDKRKKEKFIMSSANKKRKEKVHLITLDNKYFFENLIERGNDLYERKSFLADNFGVSYLIGFIIILKCFDDNIVVFDGPKCLML